jgi:GT2 family glycosyltransferase
MLVRRDAFEAAGCFDEQYFMFSEEADLARRLEPRGLEVHYVPSVEVLHHGQGSTSLVPERQVNETWRSLDLYLGRYHSPPAGSILRCLTGLGYALAVVPAAIRDSVRGEGRGSSRVYRLHVRNAFRGVRDPGLRELADEWNSSHRPARPSRSLQSSR